MFVITISGCVLATREASRSTIVRYSLRHLQHPHTKVCVAQPWGGPWIRVGSAGEDNWRTESW